MFAKIWNFILNLFKKKKPVVENNLLKPVSENEWQILSDGSGIIIFNETGVDLIPKTATLTSYGTNNEFGAWIISKEKARNFRAEMEVVNMKQLRENLPPRNYEVFWFFFNYIPEEILKKKTNYFIHKTSHGLEIGKASETYEQVFLETPLYAPVELNKPYHYSITKLVQKLTININGQKVFEKDLNMNPADKRLYDIEGHFGLYSEDAHVRIRKFGFQRL